MADTKAAHAISFRPFAPLVAVHSQTAAVEALIAEGRYDDAERASMELVHLGLQGLRYFQTCVPFSAHRTRTNRRPRRYDWFVLRTIVTVGYVGFMLYSTSFILRTHVFPSATTPSLFGPALVLAAFTALATRFVIERAPLTYYLYAAFPSFFWGSILADPSPLLALLARTTPRLVAATALVALTLELMVYGYFRREVFAAIILGMGLVWPLVGTGRLFREGNRALLRVWAGACFVLAVFPLLPVEKGESLPVV